MTRLTKLSSRLEINAFVQGSSCKAIIAVTAANVAADVMAEERADDVPDIAPAAAE